MNRANGSPIPRRPATAFTGVVPALARGIAHALTLALLLALVAWPEQHTELRRSGRFWNYSGSLLLGLTTAERLACEGVRCTESRPGVFTYRDDSFSVLARRIESIFAPASTK